MPTTSHNWFVQAVVSAVAPLFPIMKPYTDNISVGTGREGISTPYPMYFGIRTPADSDKGLFYQPKEV